MNLGYAAVTLLLMSQNPPDLKVDRATMGTRILDQRVSPADRDGYLSVLERVDFPAAAAVAKALLGDKDESLRFRAAWIVADSGDSHGVETLRNMAANRSAALTLPITALGRLRDARSHELLTTLLQTELSEGVHKKTLPRILALIGGLSEYADPADAALLARAVGGSLDLGGAWSADELGQTGGAEAIPVLTEVFSGRHGGWAVMGAGLGLARCGSNLGIEYVRNRLADTEGARHPDGEPADGVKDDPNGPRATSYILAHLGVPADERFVPTLVNVASDPRYSDHARAMAWEALLRINSSARREQVLEAAWKNLNFDGALRLIAINDLGETHARLAQMQKDSPSSALHGAESALQDALAATDREKRHWRETRGYGF